MIEGIDVSKWQGTVTWADVAAAGMRFGVARSSLGQYTHDDTFALNYKRALNNGLVPGAYHVVAADSSGAAQATNWKAALDAAGFDKGLLVLDVEAWSGTNGYPASTVLTNVEYLCDWIRNTYNRTPIIYTGVFWREELKQHPNNFGSRLWLAAYVSDPAPYVPAAWNDWTIWQYTSSGTVNGVAGNVDMNRYDGTVRALKTLAGWEWDELATKAEIQAVVREEVAAAISSCNTNRDAVINVVNTAASNVVTDVNQNVDAASGNVTSSIFLAEDRLRTDVTSTKTTLSLILQDVIAAVQDNPDALASQEIKDLIQRLHEHTCQPCLAERLQQ